MDKIRRLKYGAYAFLMTVFVIGIFAIVSLIVTTQGWKIDITQNKLFTLSKQTKDVLAGLKQEVKVEVLYLKNREDNDVNRLLQRYAKDSKNLKIEYIDIIKNPDRVKENSDVYLDTANDPYPISIILKTNKRTKVVNHYDMFAYESEQQIFMGEQVLTNAIRFISIDRVPMIYYLQGHREPPMEAFNAQSDLIRTQNYNINALNLITQKKIPGDADIIIDVSPQTGFLPEEISEMKKYIENGGKAAFFFDPPAGEKQDIKALTDMIKPWGIDVQDYVAIEGSQDGFYQHPSWIIPQLQSHEITNPLVSDQMIMMTPYSRTLKLNSQNGFTAVSLLKTSTNSWGKLNIENGKFNKEPADAGGPFDLAAVISKQIKDKNGKDIEGKVFVSGTSGILNVDILSMWPGNKDYFLNIFGWLKGESEDITIRPKPTQNLPLTMTNSQRILTIVFVLLVIPGVVIGAGIVIWARRRHL